MVTQNWFLGSLSGALRDAGTASLILGGAITLIFANGGVPEVTASIRGTIGDDPGKSFAELASLGLVVSSWPGCVLAVALLSWTIRACISCGGMIIDWVRRRRVAEAAAEVSHGAA